MKYAKTIIFLIILVLVIMVAWIFYNYKNSVLNDVNTSTTANKTANVTIEDKKIVDNTKPFKIDITYPYITGQDEFNAKVKSIVEKYKSLTRLKKINIEEKIESPATIEGSEIEFSRVLYNILDNAIKYTPEDGTITILGEKTVPFNKYLITVSDSGSGIPADIIDKIFDPFFRGDTTRSTDGAGLGLTLVKKIIEDHKGTVSITSEINKGTSVIISLPVTSS